MSSNNFEVAHISPDEKNRYVILSVRPRLHYTVFIRRRYRNAPFWPTVYTVPFSYPESNEDCCIRKKLNVYTMPFSYDNIFMPFSYENGIM